MSEYGKKTVADLTEILKSRGLPHSGKKAELIARLTEDDNKPKDTPAEEAPVTAEPEPAPEVAPIDQPAETTDVPAPAQQETSAPEVPAEPSISYALNLPTSDIDSELAKRKARAERFGTGAAKPANGTDAVAESTPQADSTSESLKALERAKRFGASEGSSAPTAISKLDEALPSDGPRGRGSKRKAEEVSALEDQGLKKSFANRGRNRDNRGGRVAHRQKGNALGGNGSRPQGVTKAPAYTSEKDKAAAEARKKKFATA